MIQCKFVQKLIQSQFADKRIHLACSFGEKRLVKNSCEINQRTFFTLQYMFWNVLNGLCRQLICHALELYKSGDWASTSRLFCKFFAHFCALLLVLSPSFLYSFLFLFFVSIFFFIVSLSHASYLPRSQRATLPSVVNLKAPTISRSSIMVTVQTSRTALFWKHAARQFR